MWYTGEVNNGGHYQFYTNSTGIVWEDAMDGFELIGLDEGKRIIEESAKRFGSKPSFVRSQRESLLDSIDEDFEDLDSQFYKLDNEINITEKIAEFIVANPIPFYFEGEIEVPK
jgi:predicted Zn-dependent protease with MMP-like domain